MSNIMDSDVAFDNTGSILEMTSSGSSESNSLSTVINYTTTPMGVLMAMT